MAAHGILRMRRDGPAVIFQVEGRGTMHHGLPLRRAAEQALLQGAMAVRVDLHLCNYMDSTFLGTLLFLLRAAACRGIPDFALVAPSPACRQLIQQMGLEDVYPIAPGEAPPDAGWTELPVAQPGTESFNRNVARAHQELANVPGPAAAQFQRVADCLAKDLPASDDDTTIITTKDVK